MNSETNNPSVRVPAACLFCPEEDKDGIHDPIHDMEIVGLYSSKSGCSCLIHKCCGKAVRVGDILHIKKTVVSVRVPAACLFCPEEDKDGIHDPIRDMEIVGLYLSKSSHSCLIHKCCGKAVKVGDILCIKKTVVNNNNLLPEEALRCIIIRQGEEACQVGFIPRFLISALIMNKNINKFLQVVELFADSNNIVKQQKSKQYGRVAAVIFLKEIPSIE